MSNYNNFYMNQHRELTAPLKKYAKKRSKISISSIVVTGTDSLGFLFPLLLICGLIAFTLDLIILANLVFNFSGEPAPAAFIITSIITNIPAVFLVIYILRNRIILFRRYCFVLMNGKETDAIIRNIDLEWNVQLNDTPRSIVNFDIDGRRIRIKTFAPEILNYCHDGSTVKLLWHEEMPDIIIPAGSLEPAPGKTEPETYSV